MPGDVSFYPEPDEDEIGYLIMAGSSRGGRAKESGPSGPVEHTTFVRATDNVFIVDNGGHRLFLTGDVIPSELAGLPQVAAQFVDGVWTPAP